MSKENGLVHVKAGMSIKTHDSNFDISCLIERDISTEFYVHFIWIILKNMLLSSSI